MNLRVFFIYICKTAHFGWLQKDEGPAIVMMAGPFHVSWLIWDENS